MPNARWSLSSSAVNEKIYVIGGYNNREPLPFSTVEEYNPATDRWEKKADMPTRRIYLSTSVVNGKIYATGGTIVSGGPGLSTVEEYDPELVDEEGQGVEAKGKHITTWGKMKK